LQSEAPDIVVSADLQGERGSVAASLEYAIDKQPHWLQEMFGSDSKGNTLLRRLLHRDNPGGKRPGQIAISVNRSALSPESIQVFVDDVLVSSTRDLLFVTRAVEKACGAIELRELPEVGGREQEGAGRPANLDSFVDDVVTKQECKKSPFVVEECPEGRVLTRIYESKLGMAMVSVFGSDALHSSDKPVLIRIHSSCVNSDVLDSTDCDCRGQLVEARRRLHKEGGVLLFFFQEGRGAGLMAKFTGMSLMQRRNISTFQAYSSLCLALDQRSYDLAKTILDDLDIQRVRLMTNNPRKVEALRSLGFGAEQVPLVIPITPINFGYMYSKWVEGSHVLSETFRQDSGVLYCKGHRSVGECSRVCIIGGDDVLWEDNVVYEDIIRQFTDYVADYVPEASRSEIRAILDEVEDNNLKVVGFGAPGFKKSLELTFERLQARYGTRLPPPRALFDRVISDITNFPVEVESRTRALLSDLRARGDYLVLLTQGPSHIQARKIARSGLATIFDAIAISPETTPATFEYLVTQIGKRPEDVYVVGNSLRSEVEPAVRAGLRAIHYRNPNSWHLLNRTQLHHDAYTTITSLTQLLTLSVAPTRTKIAV
jgi:GTP cyclohydrolase II